MQQHTLSTRERAWPQQHQAPCKVHLANQPRAICAAPMLQPQQVCVLSTSLPSLIHYASAVEEMLTLQNVRMQ